MGGLDLERPPCFRSVVCRPHHGLSHFRDQLLAGIVVYLISFVN